MTERSSRTRVVNLEEGSLVTENNAGEYFLGVPSDVFSSSAYISQMDDTHVGEEKMRETISNLLFSGNEQLSVDKAAAAINSRRVSETEEHGVGSRTLLTRAEELLAEEQRATEITEALLDRESELVKNQKAREKLEEEIAKLEKLKGSFRAIALLNGFDKLHTLEQEERLLHAEEAEFRMKHTGNGFLPDTSYRTELSINRRVTADAYHTYRAGCRQGAPVELKRRCADPGQVTLPFCVDVQFRRLRRLAQGIRGERMTPRVAVQIPSVKYVVVLFRICGERDRLVA